jgi:hypothetical protein
MSKNKETKTKEQANRDPEITGFHYDEFFNNRLALTEDIKSYLNENNLDWRFINAAQFRSEGNVHRSHWKPFKFDNVSFGSVLNAEGYIMRGDLILATRPKGVTQAHRKFLKQRNNVQKGFNKAEAQKFRQSFREQGMESQARVIEGYEDED